jgi:WD40 repeat protein
MLAAILGLVLTATPRDVMDIEVAPDDKWFAVSSGTDNVYIFSIDGKLLHTLHNKPKSALVDIEISPDGRLIACSNIDGSATPCPIWSTESWKPITHIGLWFSRKGCDPPAGIEFAAHGKYLVGATALSHQLAWWNATTGDLVYVARRKKTGVLYGYAVNPESTLIAYREGGINSILFWDPENPSSISKWGTSSNLDVLKVRSMKFSHDMRHLLIVHPPDGKNTQFDFYAPSAGKTTLSDKALIRHFEFRDLAWSNDDKLVWAVGLGGQIISIDPDGAHLKKTWIGNQGGPIHSCEALHRRHVLLAASKVVEMWDGDSGKLLRTVKMPD